MNAKEFFGKFTSFYLWGHLLAMAIVAMLLMAGVWYGLRVYTHHGEGVDIPDLSGMNSREAREMLEGKGLYMVVNDSGYNKQKPAESILAQLPQSGMKVKMGRVVYVTVNSLQSPRVAIPDLIDNSSYRQAQAHLQAIGFKTTPPMYIDGEKDWVLGIKQGNRELHTGEMVSTEQMLTLVVGRGVDDEEGEVLGADTLSQFTPLPDFDDGEEIDDFEEVVVEENI